MLLNNFQVIEYTSKLADSLTKKQADTLEAVAKLLDGSQKANLGKALAIVAPGKDDKEALNSLRVLRSKVNDIAKKNGIQFEFCVDSEKRKSPDQRECWFYGADLSSEKMERLQEDLLRSNPEYQPNNYTPPMSRSKFPVFISSSDNRGAEAATDEERVIIEDFIRRLRLALKGLNRYDLANGLYHFREQQDNLMFKRIEEAINGCEVGLLLFSKPYMASKYVKEKEIPRFNPMEFHTGKEGAKDSIPLLLSPCFDNDPARINEILGLAAEGGFQILRHKDKRSFIECTEQEKESFVDQVANRLNQKIPELTHSSPQPPRGDHLDIFTIRQRDKLCRDNSYCPDEWEPTRGECPEMGRAGTKSKTVSESAAEEPSKGFDALERLTSWAKKPDSAHVHALLGDLGSGKTFTSRMLALRLLQERMSGNNKIPLPIYIDLREVGFTTEWQGSPTLEHILEGWLKHWQFGLNPGEEHGLDMQAIFRISQTGALWIFDGFDEISTHLPRNADTAFFRELLRPIAPQSGKQTKSKVLVSCRSHYFPTLAKQNATLLEEARGILKPGATRDDGSVNPALICDSTILLPFDEDQIRNYLCRTLGAAEAERALEVIAGIHDLNELSRQPYLLRLIRTQIAQLEVMKSQGKPVNAASLYGLFVDDWLQRDEGKHTVEPEDKLRLMERLAARMWNDRHRGWTFEQLQRWALTEVEQEPDWRFRYQPHADLIAKDLHTAAFIVRYGEKSFRFIHTSMQEYFVAAHLLRGLREQRLQSWDIAQVSVETLAFLADLWQLCPAYDHDLFRSTLRKLHATPPSPAAALSALDYLLAAREKRWPHLLPENIDLSGADISERKLQGQPGHPWRINLLRLDNANARQLQMSYLKIDHLEAVLARLSGGIWQHCIIENATLTDTNLSGTKFRHCHWQNVCLTQISMRHAELRYSMFELREGTSAREITGPVWWLDSNAPTLWAVDPQSYTSALPLCFARTGHDSSISNIAWRGDSRQLASGSYDGTVRIWDAASGACLQTLTGHERGVRSVAWRSDGRQLASGGGDGTVRIWDVASGTCIQTLTMRSEWVRSVAWHSDGRQLASGGNDGAVRIWDVASGACLQTLTGHSDWVTSVAWRSDSSQLASGGDDGTIRIWDAASGECLQTLPSHQRGIMSVAWCSDGRQLASGDYDGFVRIWNVASGACLQTLAGHNDWVFSVAWRSDGRKLASGGGDGTVRIWDVASGVCLQTLTGHNDWVMSVVWHSDGSQLASGGDDGTVRIWDATSGACLQALTGYKRGVRSVVWRSCGSQFASGGYDGVVRIWDSASGVCLQTLTGHEGGVMSVAWRSDGSQFASCGYDGTVRIWDATSGVCLQTLTGHEGGVMSVDWCSDGSQLASGGNDGTVRIWDAASGACLETMTGHERGVKSVSWRCDGSQLASGGGDEIVRIWDVFSGACLQTLPGHESGVRSVAWCSDGSLLATVGGDGTVRIWDAVSGACLQTLIGHERGVRSIVWRCGGSQLASAGGDGTVRIWDVASGACLQTLTGHNGWVMTVAWRSDGSQLASGGHDGTVRIWDLASGKTLFQCVAIGTASAVLDANGEVCSANDDAWPFLARMGENPETGEWMWVPAEVDDVITGK